MDKYTIHIMYITTYYIILYVFKIYIFMYLSKMMRIYMIRWAQICKYGIEELKMVSYCGGVHSSTKLPMGHMPTLDADPSLFICFFFRPWKIIHCSNLNVVRAIFWQNPSVLSAILEILAMDARIEWWTIQIATPGTELQSSTHIYIH